MSLKFQRDYRRLGKAELSVFEGRMWARNHSIRIKLFGAPKYAAERIPGRGQA